MAAAAVNSGTYAQGYTAPNRMTPHATSITSGQAWRGDRVLREAASPTSTYGCGAGRRMTTAVIRAANHGDDFFHGLGHSIGLEVHDAEDLSQPIPAGAVMTIEPGIYLSGRFGVRIEDDFLVTARGYEHLSSGVPRAIEAVEAAIGRA